MLTALTLLQLCLTCSLDDGTAVNPFYPHERPALYLTSYDYRLGGLNCDGDCGNTALTTTGADILNWTGACPTEWLGWHNTTVVTFLDLTIWCTDSFGATVNQRLTAAHGRVVYRIDVLWDDPRTFPYNQWIVEDWSSEWRPMALFYALRAQRRAAGVVVN